MKAKIKIIKQSGTGWVSEQPNPEEFIVEVTEGTKLENISSMGATAMVKGIVNGQIVLVTNGLAPKGETLGINLMENFSDLETIIKLGDSYKFVTQTMDVGITYTVTLLEISG